MPLMRVSKMVIKSGDIKRISVKDDDVTVEYVQSNRPAAKSRKETNVSIFETLTDLGVSQEELNQVEIEVIAPSAWSDWGTLAITILPLLFLLLFFYGTSDSEADKFHLR